MTYNLYIQCGNGQFNLFDLPNEKLEKVLLAYLKGDSKFTLSGQTYHFGNSVDVFKICENESGRNQRELDEIVNMHGNQAYFGGAYFTPEELEGLGKNVSDEIVGDREFGCEKEKIIQSNEIYINLKHIEILEKLNEQTSYDLSKLVGLCKEVNDNFVRHNYYSVSLLLRTILNHVPPVFNGKDNFDQVLAELNGPKHRTKRELLSRLNELQRKLADLVTHATLKEFEPEITRQQVSFIPEIDYLLTEVISELKCNSHYLI
ncbi:hypothetical protein [Sphingobacterium sp. WOUb80]|uniref:hypothetical protein n=1 Tax=Sphingobacterium sp. WOUb80 TaxID=3234028 RepID=UPI003CF09F0B